MPRTGRQCPHCGSVFVLRSHRRPFEKLYLGLLGLTPFRCDSCDRRFYQRSSKHDGAPPAALPTATRV